MRSKLKIIGKLDGTFEELHAAGCIQTGADAYQDLGDAVRSFGGLLAMLQVATGGNVCDGCPWAEEGNPSKVEQVKCEAFQKYHSMAVGNRVRKLTSLKSATSPPGTDKYPGLSIAQIAERLGVSKSEVRRRKQAGTI